MLCIRRTAMGLVVLVGLATILGGFKSRKHAVVMANPASGISKTEQIAQADQGYGEAQRRIQAALKTQAVELKLQRLSLTQLPPEIG